MNYRAIYKYFIENSGIDSKHFVKNEKGQYTGKFVINNKECKLKSLEKIFERDINCNNYETVVSGEGNEQEKIDTIYSSSLQSLLFFDKTKQFPIKIEFRNDKVIEFDEVVFEYKNKVIGYPSSVDVVLINKKEKAICFIESKLLEIVRDSSLDGKSVVGISYFQKDGVGYRPTLNLSKEDLDKIGISYPKDGPFLDKVKCRSKEVQLVNPILLGKDNFVYSEGIKQVLAHLIGIETFKTDSCYEQSNDPIQKHELFEHYFYIELYNELPNLDSDYADKKLNDFRRHFNVVKDIVEEKNVVEEMKIMSYQDLFKENKNHLNDKIINFYHWNGK